MDYGCQLIEQCPRFLTPLASSRVLAGGGLSVVLNKQFKYSSTAAIVFSHIGNESVLFPVMRHRQFLAHSCEIRKYLPLVSISF